VLRALGGRIPLVVDGGETTVKTPSTLVDLSRGEPARILRAGAIDAARIAALVPLR
jgi:tRNA A37 threonylcarbamoyladenosine synthetase subunit TsaC/SUA5/YrdC